ncbi:hypothetical protein [Cronobacter malonaticus]|uniref:hypothetical protein n=1 Tax=Cronobacter malonaticus TaxID=413503 RepID=UPI000CFDBBC1|nr:hypothetical protein [Cronobacter malonaticus]
MAYGIKIVNSNGKIFATPETPFMHMAYKKSFSVGDMALGNKAVAYNTGIPANVRILCYARCSTQTLFFVTPYQSGGTWWFKINSSKAVSGTFYFFTNEIPPSSGGWGLDMFNASGQRVYSTSTKPLQNLQTSLSRNGVKTFQAGFPTAAIATPCEYWVQPIKGGLEVQLFVAAPCATGNQLDLTAVGTGIMRSSEGFSFTAFGGVVNYINASLYD